MNSPSEVVQTQLPDIARLPALALLKLHQTSQRLDVGLYLFGCGGIKLKLQKKQQSFPWPYPLR